MVIARCLLLVVVWLLWPTAAGFSQNLLSSNPGFDAQDFGTGTGNYAFTGWQGQNYRYSAFYTVASTLPQGGSRAFHMDNGGYVETADVNRAAVTGGDPYLLEFQCRKPYDAFPWQYIGLLPSIKFFDASGTLIRQVRGEEVASSGTSDWTRYRLAAAAPANAVTAAVRLEFNSGSYPNEDGRQFEIDSVSLIRFTDQPAVGFRNAPMTITPGISVAVPVKYRAPVARDLLVRLTLNDTSVAEVRITGVHGRGLTNVTVPLPGGAIANTAYQWTARLVAPGAAWETGGVTATVANVLLDQAVQTGNVVTADNPNLTYEGRWDRADPASPRVIWQGASLRARFSGTSFAMDYVYDYGSEPLVLRVEVDGVDITAAGPLSLPSTATTRSATLVSGLASGTHTLAVLREGDEDQGFWVVKGVRLDPGAGLLRYRPFMDRRIEFYGDSTSSGGDGGMYVSFTKATARALGAASNVISKGATGVSGGFVFDYDALYYWDRLYYNVYYDARNGASDYVRNPYTAATNPDSTQQRGVPWGPGNFADYGDPASPAEISGKGNFATWQADAVVIGYGQNDQFGNGPFADNYRQFVTLLRKVYPNAHLFMTHTNMTTDDRFFQSAMEPIINDRGVGGLNADGHVHMLIVRPASGGSGGGGHPSAAEHQQLAYGNLDWRGTADWIEETMGWSGAAVGDPIEVQTPVFIPPAGTYEAAQTVAITTTTPGATIRYTLDGTAPTASSPVYTAPFTVNGTTTIRAYATAPNLLDSNASAATLVVQVAAPRPSLPSGAYTDAQTVTLTTTTAGATILHTLDGSDPKTGGIVYSAPISLSSSKTLRAIAVKSGVPDSNPVMDRYSIRELTGVLGQYYYGWTDQNAIDYDHPQVARVDPNIDFNWTNATPGNGMPQTNYAAQWTGYVVIPTAGAYTFYAASDDGIRVWLNDVLVDDSYVPRPLVEDTISAGTFAAGARVKLTVRYFQLGGGAEAHLRWQGPGIPKQAIPPDYFVQTSGLDIYHQQYGVTDDLATPAHDGVSNLAKYAFNLGDPNVPNATALTPGGTSGLPRLDRNGTSGAALTFVRRKASTNPGLTTTASSSADLVNWTPLSPSADGVTSIDQTWEQVTVAAPAPLPGRFFLRVDLQRTAQ